MVDILWLERFLLNMNYVCMFSGTIHGLVCQYSVFLLTRCWTWWHVYVFVCICARLAVRSCVWLFAHITYTWEEFDVRTTTFTRVMKKIVLLENVWWFRSFIHLIILLVTTFPTHFARVFHQMIRFNHFN